MLCYVGDLKEKAVNTFMMYTHFNQGRIMDKWLFPIHMSANHCSPKGALSKLIAND